MKAKNDEHRSSYQSLPSCNEKPKDKRPSSPDSRDADTEASTSDNEENTASNQPFKELQDYSEKPPMSNKRRICLVGSLLLCVFTVFAFAFILPCHHKTCLKETKWPKWSKNFSGIAPIVLRDVPSTASSNRRILVGFSHSGRGFHILNHTCPGCHGGVVALDGGDGEQLWASGVLGQFGNILCDLNVEEDQQSCIALEDKDKILRIDSNNGSQHWTVKKTGMIKAFKAIRDIDGDGVGEIVLLYVPRPGFTSQLCILSGKTGKHIGRSLTVTKSRTTSELHHDVFLRLHQVSDSKQLLLVGVKLASQETGTLLVIRIEDLVTRIHNKTTRGLRWGPNAPNQYGFIELYKDTLVLTPPLFADLNNDGVKDIVLCSLEAGLIVKAINGKDTSHLWSRKLTSTGIRSALPTIVPFGDKVTDIAIMIELDNKSTRIVVLNGKNGLALWMFTLNSPLTVPPVGVPHRLHTPRGLILWLPKVNVRKYMRKRESVKVPSYDMNYKWRKDGPRRKRGTEYLNEDENNMLLDDLLDELKREQEESENSNMSDHDDNVLSSRVQFGKERSAYSKDHGSGGSDVKNDAVINIDDGDDHSQSDSKHQHDNGDDTNGSDDIHEDDWNNDSDDDDDDSVINDSVNAGNDRKTDEIVELREYLINLEDRLKRQTDSRKIKPTTAIPWTTTTISATSQQLTQTNQALKENMAKESKPQQDKPLNCDLPLVTVNKDISAVLVYRDPKNQLQLIEMAREKVINIAPEDFVNKFGEQPPVAYSCVQLIPTITTRPIVTDIDGDHRLDLIYAVDYVTQKPSTGPARITHLMKLKKVDISDAIANKHNRKLSNKLYRSDRNNYKRNENFDSPFLTWNT